MLQPSWYSSPSSSIKSIPRFRCVNVKFHSSAAGIPPPPDEEEDSKETKEDDKTIASTEIRKQDVKVSKDKPWLLDLGVPSLVPQWRLMFNSKTLFTDISAGITVGW